MAEKDDAPTVADIENGSIEDDLRASFAEAGKEPAAEPATEAAAEEPAKEDEKPEAASGERARDDKGRFVAKEGDAPEVEAKPEAEPPADAAPLAAETPAAEPLEPPVEWPLEKQTAFRALPPDQQKFILEQVGGVSEKLTETEKAGARFKALDEMLAPRREQWARDGFDEVSILRQTFALMDFAKNQPVEFLQWFAQSKGIDLGQFGQRAETQPDPNDPYANDPVVQRVNAQLASVTQQLAALQQENQGLKNTWQARQQQEQQAQQQRLEGEITSFSTSKDEKGNLKHPYFPIVRSHMSALFKENLASTLEDAYDQACHANPEVRAKIAAANEHKAQQERARQAKEKADAARKAGSSVSGSPVTTRSEPQSTGDVFNDLRAEFDRARGASAI